MSEPLIRNATVTKIVPTAKWDAARTEIDIVYLSLDGKLYAWETPRGRYVTGEQVAVNPPGQPGANITPARQTKENREIRRQKL